MTPLERAAVKWWRLHRPFSFGLREHLANPTINAGYTPASSDLAKAVAKALQAERKRCLCGLPSKHEGECPRWEGTGHG
jgi:hypothetical protein